MAVVFAFTRPSSAEDELLKENIEALADPDDPIDWEEAYDDTSGEGGGGGKCPTGGMANTKCNYWKIVVNYSFPWPTTSCETEGSHKCAEGKCPHGN